MNNNVLIIIPERKGTIAGVAFNMYKAISQSPNTTVWVADLGNTGESFPFDNVFTIKPSHIPLLGRVITAIRRINLLKSVKCNKHIDISISSSEGCNFWNAITKKKDKCIGIFHVRIEQNQKMGLLVYSGVKFSKKYIYTRLDRIFAVNKSAQISWQTNLPTKKVELVYNIHLFDRIIQLSKSVIPAEDMAIFKDPVLLFVGHLYKIKGPDRLIKAFAHVHKSFPELKLVFIGTGFDTISEDEIKELIASEAISESVRFLGFKDNPYPYLKYSTMLVSPSREEGLPGVLIEALSLGTKVVATNSSIGVWEIMGCDEDYDANLTSMYETEFGVITNNCGDEDSIVKSLADGICKCYSNNYRVSSFDKEKFSKERFLNKLYEGFDYSAN